MNDQKIKNLLNKYLSGEATRAEAFIVESWLESFQQDEVEAKDFGTAEQHNLLAEQIIAKTLGQGEIVPQKPHHTFTLWKKFTAIAALLAVISAIAILYFKQGLGEKKLLLAMNYDKFVTPIKEFKQLQLPDSTVVYLNANSTLEVQQDFTKQSERRVKLTGEAFFEVKKDSKHPFKIQVGELQVKVLGTSFNIKAHPTTNEIKVAVKTGKVNVSSKAAILASLVANQALVFNKDKKTFDVQADEENGKALWRDGIMVLDKASFAELSTTFYNVYGIRLKSDDSELLNESYNFTIRSSRTWQQTINQLGEMINKKYRKEGSSIVIF
ncbi:FecR family protein [Pedobacter ureilyticus]|uniref:FecR family protein n=1 Tax=Pedobacter ureilyticus TaxID=1393051 RepID=A0ABW9J0A8_9SPHI|nr:FecR family protein [Pedobacter helvus]